MFRKFLKSLFLLVALTLLVAIPADGPERFATVLQSFREDWNDVEDQAESHDESGSMSTSRSPQPVETVDPDRIRRTIQVLSSLKSRVPGYPGHGQAFEFTRDAFQRLGYAVLVDTFEVTVPIDHGGSLTDVATGESTPVYSFWPNHVQPPTLPEGGITGPLFYGGRGTLKELNGKIIDGAIALLDFGSGKDYLNACMLGAKAVIFFDNGDVTRHQAQDKILNVPADIPRYWIDRSAADRLLQRITKRLQSTGARDPGFESTQRRALSAPRFHLDARMTWKKVPAWNLIAVAPERFDSLFGPRSATDRRLLVVGSYYDAMSVVPAIAPGAEAATGLAATLEVARALKGESTEHDLAFLVTGAHFMGLQGALDFVHRHARGRRGRGEIVPTADREIDFDLFAGIDLTSESNRVVALPHGTLNNPGYRTELTAVAILAPSAKRLAKHVDIALGGTRLINGVGSWTRSWIDFIGADLAFDHEAIQIVGRHGLTLASPWASRRRVDTPVDAASHVDIDNVVSQTQALVAGFVGVLDDPLFIPETELSYADHGYTLTGRALRYDRDVDFALPSVPVSGAIVVYRPQGIHADRGGVRTLYVDEATKGPARDTRFGFGPGFGDRGEVDRTGRFRFDLLVTRFFGAGAVRVEGFGLDARSRIVYAPDHGSEVDFPTLREHSDEVNQMLMVLFPGRSQTLIETIDPTYLNPLSKTMLLTAGDTVPLESAYLPRLSGGGVPVGVAPVAVTFGPFDEESGRTTPMKILMASDLFGQKLLLLNTPEALFDDPVGVWQVDESVESEARGRGFEPGLIERPFYQAANDTWVLDDVRMKRLRQYGITNHKVERLHAEARTALLAARSALAALDYEAFVAHTRRAWSLEARAYPEVMGTATDSVRGIVFYFILLIPCSLFFERLLVGATSVRGRLFGFAGFFIAFFLALRLVHPAFNLTSSPYIVFLAFVILALGVSAAVLVISKFGQETLRLRQEATGVIEDDVGRMGVTWTAVNLGISNLRKRPLRTALTVITLTLLTFTALSLTSVKSSIVFFKLPRPTEPNYKGFMIRDRAWRPLDMPVLDYARSEFGDRASIAPRAWLTTKVLGQRAYFDFEAVSQAPQGEVKQSYVTGLVGYTVQEQHVSHLDRFLAAGRWFLDNRESSCILPDRLAEVVGITAEDVGSASIRLHGQTFTVVGLQDTDAYQANHDLDGEPMTPIRVEFEREVASEDRRVEATTQASREIDFTAHIETMNTLILPYDRVLELGGDLYSVSVGNFDTPSIADEMESFLKRISITAFLGEGDEVVAYSSIGSIGVSGIGNLFLPILLASLIVLNTMLGAVYERTREIGVYTAVGLAPNHVGALFIAEASVYATVAAVVGYLMGQAAVILLSAGTGGLGGLEVNYSSLAVVWTTLVVMATTFASTLYPARQAANLAVPDVTRRWAFPEPRGDNLVFDFPFTVGARDVLSLITYLVRVFESYEEGTATAFEVDRVDFAEREIPGRELQRYEVDMTAWLPPYDFGISQTVKMTAFPSDEHHDLFSLELALSRLSGDTNLWQHANRAFLNAIRKQFLVWRTASPEEKQRYGDEGRQILNDQVGEPGREGT